MQRMLCRLRCVTGTCLAAMTVVATACGDDDDPADLSDGQILQALMTANEAEVEMGTLALARAEREDVRDFAQRMIIDHTEARLEERRLANQTGVRLGTSDVNRQLEREAREMRDLLLADMDAGNGEQFDARYIATQVTMHRSLLEIIDARLLPSVDRAEIRAHLESIRSSVAEHLGLATALQDDLPDVDLDAGVEPPPDAAVGDAAVGDAAVEADATVPPPEDAGVDAAVGDAALGG